MTLSNRYDFVYYFDVQDGNPNGDPDAGNLPRVDAETGMGLVTDVCLKRKIRNHVALVKGEQPPYEIYVKERAILNEQHARAYVAIGAEVELEEAEGDDKDAKGKKGKKAKRKGGEHVDEARAWMCANFFDVRTFGAVMSTGTNCGQVRGPVQLTFARSADPIMSLEHSITRMAVTTKEEAEKQEGDNRTMGRKFTVPYGLYRAHGFVSAHLAAQTGFGEKDLSLLWDALCGMFEHDRSAARGLMTCKGLYIFKHANALGSAPAHTLFDRVSAKLIDENKAPRSFKDYTVTVNEANMPDGITLTKVC